jgi:hypothetical protein
MHQSNLSTSEPIGDGWSILRGVCADLEWNPSGRIPLVGRCSIFLDTDMYLRILGPVLGGTSTRCSCSKAVSHEIP